MVKEESLNFDPGRNAGVMAKRLYSERTGRYCEFSCEIIYRRVELTNQQVYKLLATNKPFEDNCNITNRDQLVI